MENTPEIYIVPAGSQPYSFKGSVYDLASHDHVHNDRGECLQNRLGVSTYDCPRSGPPVVQYESRKPAVGLYRHGSWRFDVTFKKKWQARLFHWLLNQTDDFAGTRDY